MGTEELIPPQEGGVQTNTESSTRLCGDKEAESFYQEVRGRLLDVNRWHELAGAATADFQLTDAEGKEVDRTARTGDHFRIRIPGPGSITGEGNDWVRIEAIEDRGDALAIRVRPATNPQNDRQDVAHFFSPDATSSFIVRREGDTVTAGVYGRNEKPNTDTETTIDKLRNAAVATGAITGFSKLQWKSLVNGLVKK